jgi:hypothetical protein
MPTKTIELPPTEYLLASANQARSRAAADLLMLITLQQPPGMPPPPMTYPPTSTILDYIYPDCLAVITHNLRLVFASDPLSVDPKEKLHTVFQLLKICEHVLKVQQHRTEKTEIVAAAVHELAEMIWKTNGPKPNRPRLRLASAAPKKT